MVLPVAMLALHRVVERPGPGRAATLGTSLFAAALCCGYYAVYAGLLRAPVRFGIVVTMALALLAAVGLSTLLRDRRRPAAVVTLVGVAAILELTPIPLRFGPVPSPALAYRVLATLPDGVVAEFPFFSARRAFHRHTLYMLKSTYHWKPLVNGHSDVIPSAFRDSAGRLAESPSARSFLVLRGHRTRYVLFHLDLYDPATRGALTGRLAEWRAFLRSVVREGRVWLYEIVAWPKV